MRIMLLFIQKHAYLKLCNVLILLDIHLSFTGYEGIFIVEGIH